MEKPTTRLRALLKKDGMLYFPAAYYPLGGRMIELDKADTREDVAEGISA